MTLHRCCPTLLAIFGVLLSAQLFGADNDAEKHHSQAHDLRIKAAQLHEQALKEIDDADAKQVESDKAYKEAAALDKKGDEAEKVTPEQARARALRHQAHEDERQAEIAEASAKTHAQRSKREAEHAEDAKQTLNDLKGKNSETSELKLIEDDVAENQKKAKEEEDGSKKFDTEATRLKKAAADLLAQADKLDPAGKDKDQTEHHPSSKK